VALAILDFETLPVDTLRVRVADSGGVPMSAEATVVVSLTDVNEAPVLGAGQALSVPENSAVGTLVGSSLTHSEPDAGQTAAWAITAGNTADQVFAVDAARGQLSVSAAVLNFEGTASYVLTVQVTDSGSPALSASASISVSVTDVNEAPVFVAATVAAKVVPENSPVGTSVGSAVQATDVDNSGTQAVTYALSASEATFRIADPASGQLSVRAAALDFDGGYAAAAMGRADARDEVVDCR
jgi:hypothetical protein